MPRDETLAADEIHGLAVDMRAALNIIINTRYQWRVLETPVMANDAHMMHDLLLEATISTAAIASLLARMERKKRYPDEFLTAEKP